MNMSGQPFATFLPRIRDRGMPFLSSWVTRYYGEDTEPEDNYFDLWSIKPLIELSVEDILWSLVAAAQDPFATHLQLYVFIGNKKTCQFPNRVFKKLMKDLATQFGFSPMEWGTDFKDEDGDFSVVISLFSEHECDVAEYSLQHS